ncbi:ATP-binding protein [Pseudomonas aeruginosa]|nr:ATP-binding protein [Pseudomonas aeruginosa]
MSQRHGWDIRTRMLAISLGPALLLTLLLTAYFTYSRLQDLRQELTHTGQLIADQLIADQLAPAAEYGVIAGNTPVLQKLLQATLDTPHVRFIEVRDRNDNILVYVEQLPGALQNAAPIDIFHSTIQRQRIALASDPLLDGASEGDGQSGEDYLGRVVVGMSNDAFSQRQQEILLKAALLAAFALILTFLVARRLAQRLSAPISTMGQAVEAIQSGDYKTSLPILDDGEIGDLARHINNLASGLDRASREQEQAISQLISAREEAEQANRAKSDFLAMMSHELRTPMNGVLGMLQLLETTEQTREQAEYTALATESTEHLLKVINDILDFSRIERGALELECIPFNLLELVQGSALVFQHSAQQRGLALELQIQAGLENIEVCGDPTRIRQILVNLLGNALKFTEEGAIHLSLEWQALDHDVLWLTCAVHDSGIGISPERLEHMFDAFQQADSSISRRYGGTGLGLAIARTLAERMGGTLQAESKEGSGSTFTLEIPLPFQQSPAHRQQAAGDAAPVAAGQEILLVEDNPVNQTVIEAMLRSLGYRVTLVADGIQAVRSAERQRYDAILMDCRLPVLDGYSATREIRAQENGRQVPIIALTANALQGDRENCLQAGMNDYLAKPFKRAELQRILQRWIGSQPELPVTSNETGRGEPE